MVSVTASEDGKSASVVFKNSFVADTEQTVKVTDASGTKELKFTFTVGDITSVELEDGTYDDDTKNQTLTFKANGVSSTADAEFLRQAGYTVNFVAVDEDNVAANIFDGAKSNSATGLLDDEIATGTYTVEVQIIKDGKIIVSDKGEIKIVDLESTATAISLVEITNYGADKVVGGTDNFVHKSTTLVAGEVAEISEVKGSAAGKTDVELIVNADKVTSSNPAVISVANVAGVATLSANGAGTATIKVQIGDVSKEVTLTVSNDLREVKKITPAETTVKVVKGVTRTVEVSAADQYGDPIAIATGDAVVSEDLPKDSASNPLLTEDELITDADGKTTAGYDIIGLNKGNGTLIFKDSDGKNLGQIAITVTETNNVASEKLETTYDSKVTNGALVIGDADKNSAKYQVSKFNSEGAYNGQRTLELATDVNTDGIVDAGFAPTAGSYNVISTKPSVATVAVAGDIITVTPVKVGSADIVIYDENGVVKQKVTINVTEKETVATKVNFKELSTIDYIGKSIKAEDFLDVRTDGALNPIVYGIEHNGSTIDKVRLDSTANVADEKGNAVVASATAPVLYIDADNDGARDAGEVVLGIVSATPLTGESLANMVAGTPVDIIAGSGLTDAKDKGTLLVRIVDDKNDDGTYAVNETIATTTINIDVK